LDKDEEKFEKFLLRDATKTEIKVYQNMKKVDPDILTNLAQSAIEKLDSENEEERIFGAGEITEMESQACYIGDWVFGGHIWHRWLHNCKRLITPAQEQAYRNIGKNIFRSTGFLYWDCDFKEKNTQIYFKGKSHMEKSLTKLGINWTTVYKE